MRTLRPSAPLAVLLAGVAALAWMSQRAEPDVRVYVCVLIGTAAITTALLWRVPIISARFVFIGALLAHGVTLAGTPAFEDDYFRFIWDGWRTWQDGTPYGVPPEDYFGEALVPANMELVLDGVNYPEYPTIYGPTLQLAFSGVFAFFGAHPLGLQILFGTANLLLVALMLRRHDPGAVALYAWSPLVIAETSLHLHPDGLLTAGLYAALAAGRARPVLAGILLGLSAGAKLVALAAWPILLRFRPIALIAAPSSMLFLYLLFLVQGQGAGFESTATFATLWHFNPLLYEPLFHLFGWQAGRAPALLMAGLLVLWLHARSRSVDDVPLAAIFGVILLFAPVVNSWYLLWVLPFAVGRNQIWPFAATLALPLSYLTGLNLNDPTLEGFAVHPLARAGEWAILSLALLYDWRTHQSAKILTGGASVPPIAAPKVAVIMPALDEEASVGAVVKAIRAVLPTSLEQVIVVDNGSADRTAMVARAAGAIVVAEAARGYGAACLAGIAQLDPDIDIILFLDSDGSDVLEDAPDIIAPIALGAADLVIGSRTLGKMERGAMTMPQRFGNWLAPWLVQLVWGVRYSDLGPFRAIRHSSLELLAMQDRDFGWTIEMQVRAAKLRLCIVEIPTGYRRRIGISKISGTVKGVVKAGIKILYVIGREAFGDFDAARRRR